MREGFLFLCLTVAFFKASGQTCVHAGLSKSLLFKTQPKWLKRADGFDSCRVRIIVINKLRSQPVFTAILASGFLFIRAYEQCNAVRSYTTGAGQDAAIQDYDYGDLVVADFNFDGKEDFAAKNDSGGNRGPTYSYYIQNNAGSFVLDNFLTERMSYFPQRIDKTSYTLTLESDKAGYIFKTTYQFTSKTRKWRETKYKPVRLK